MRLAAAALLFATLAFARPAAAQQAVPGGGYMQFRAGAYMPQHEDMDFFDPGFDGELVLGRMVAPSLAVEAGVGYFRASGSYSEVDPWDGTVYSGKATIAFVPVTGSLRAIASSGPVSISGLAGLGLYFVSMDIEETETWGPYTYSASDSDSDTFLGLHVGGAAALQIGPRTSLGLDLRYVIGEANLFDVSGNINGLRASLALLYTF